MTKSRFVGLNDDLLTAKAKKLMPKEARLLESEEERWAFVGLHRPVTDLWAWDVETVWIGLAFGTGKRSLYCTTRPRNWWKPSSQPEKPARPAEWAGLNPEKLNDAQLAKMPNGARLLESEIERKAFELENKAHDDLFTVSFLSGENVWGSNCSGAYPEFTYCTTRARGWWRQQAPQTQEDNGTVRKFATGATRDTAQDKIDYDGFLSPYVIEAYGQYMHKHRIQSDGSLRDSDNWQKGIPRDVYRKSEWRHHVNFWKHARRGEDALAIEDALALLFNISGWLHETIKAKEGGKQ